MVIKEREPQTGSPEKEPKSTNKLRVVGATALLAAGIYVGANIASSDSPETPPQNIEDIMATADEAFEDAGIDPDTLEPINSSEDNVIELDSQSRATESVVYLESGPNWSKRLWAINDSNEGINWGAVFEGNVSLTEPNNPLAVIEYHTLQVFGALCTGDTARHEAQYIRDDPRDDDLFAVRQSVIETFQQDTGQERYDPYDTKCNKLISFGYDVEGLRDINWGDNGMRVEFTLPTFNPETGGLDDMHYDFVNQGNGHWALDSSDKRS